MGFKRERSTRPDTNSEARSRESQFTYHQQTQTTSQSAIPTFRDQAHAEAHYGQDIESANELYQLQRLEKRYGDRLHGWLEEGMPKAAMGKPHEMADFRIQRSLEETHDADSESDSSEWLSSHDGDDSSGSLEGDDVDVTIGRRRQQLQIPREALDATEFQLSLHQQEAVPAPTNTEIQALEQELATVQRERQAAEPHESAVSSAIGTLSMTFNTLWNTDD